VADEFAFLGEPEVFGITTRADAPSPKRKWPRTAFESVDAGIWGFMLEFVLDDGAKRTLKLRDGQHEYAFTAK
jgi:hypothetical protein